MNKLAVLDENQTKVFFSPMEGNDTLVRTGVITFITPLLHCLLHATSKEYVELEPEERKKMASNLYSHISDKITEEQWKLSKGEISSKLLFIKNVVNSLKKIKDKKEELYELLFQLVSVTFIENILEKNKELEIDSIVSKVNIEVKMQLETSLKKLEEKKRRVYIEKFLELLRNVFSEAEEISSAEKKSPLQFVLNQKNVRILADKFNRNIYFIDSENRLPYKVNSLEDITERKSIIVLRIKDKYEIVGKLLTGNKIQREFSFEDQLIKRIHTFLYFPEEIPKKFPFLAVHLPKTVTKQEVKVETKTENKQPIKRPPLERPPLERPPLERSARVQLKLDSERPSERPSDREKNRHHHHRYRAKTPERRSRAKKSPAVKSSSSESSSESSEN